MPTDREVSLTGSHIRPQPGYGYDERRHVTVWGPASIAGGTVSVAAGSAWGWDEAEVPFFEYSERSVGKSRKYFDALSVERGTPVKPKLSLGFLTLRTTRLPFLTATIVPVTLGILIATSRGQFDLVAALLTIIGACFVQLGLNVANDVFDTIQGADDANVTPTQFSGGSRVIQYGLVSLRQMATLSTLFYALAGVIGLVLLATHGSTALLVIGVVGFIVSLGYTAPPLKFVYRGLGEIAVALGFGPLMLLGAYVVQTGGALAWEPVVASIPVALLVALILYVNEIPDRRGDAHVGQAHPAGAPLEGGGHRRVQPRGSGRLRRDRGRRGGRHPAHPGVADAADDPARGPCLARPCPQLRQPVRAHGRHGRERQAAPLRGPAAARRVWGRADRRSGGPERASVPRLRAARARGARPRGPGAAAPHPRPLRRPSREPAARDKRQCIARYETGAMDAVRFGLSMRALRRHRRWTQQRLADEAGVTRGVVARIEGGHGDRVTVRTLIRVAAALGGAVTCRLFWHGEGLDRLLDADHARLLDQTLTFLAAKGWQTATEVTFNIGGERGAIDILAFHEATGSLLVIEIKTVVPDLQATLGTLDRKVRVATQIAASAVGSPRACHGCSSCRTTGPPVDASISIEPPSRRSCRHARWWSGSGWATLLDRWLACCSCQMNLTRSLVTAWHPQVRRGGRSTHEAQGRPRPVVPDVHSGEHVSETS